MPEEANGELLVRAAQHNEVRRPHPLWKPRAIGREGRETAQRAN